MSQIITADHTKLLEASHATRLNQTFHSQNGIMTTLTAFFQQTVLNNLEQSVVPAADVDLSTLSRDQKSEILHVLTTTTKSRIASVIRADLALRVNRIDSARLKVILVLLEVRVRVGSNDERNERHRGFRVGWEQIETIVFEREREKNVGPGNLLLWQLPSCW